MTRFALTLSLLLVTSATRAEEPKRFPAAKHGAGELKYVGDVPVLVLKGTPAEMGEQFGKLAISNAPDLDALHKQFLADAGQEKRYPILAAMSPDKARDVTAQLAKSKGRLDAPPDPSPPMPANPSRSSPPKS